jgi:UDP-glucuronate decarboxylase
LDTAVETGATVLIASTSEVYGNPEVHPQPESYHGNVNPRGARAPYDEGKRFSEALATAYRSEYDVDVRTVRLFNTYGPRMRIDDGRVVPTFIRQALEGEPLTVHGDGTQTRSFCYVSDIVDGIYRLATVDGLSGEVVNLGSTEEITIRTLAETILELIDTSSDITFESRPTDDPDLRRPDISRARNLLDWEPTAGLETGLAKTIESFETGSAIST